MCVMGKFKSVLNKNKQSSLILIHVQSNPVFSQTVQSFAKLCTSEDRM